MAEKKAPRYYSGDKSDKFWNRVNSLSNEADKRRVYSLGVILQDLENHALRELMTAELRDRVEKNIKA